MPDHNCLHGQGLGANWEDNKLQEFDKTPFAAASIGQELKAKLKDGTTVSAKVHPRGG